MAEVKLPELGENIDTVDVAAVLVEVGQRVRRDQPVLEVETEKASLEIPADTDGTVTELLVGKGDKVKVGQAILRIEPGEAGAGSGGSERPSAARETSSPAVEPEPASRVVGAPGEAAHDPEPSARESVIAFPRRTGGARPEIGPTVPAAPSVRALARELGLDLHEVRGSGPGGRISRDDVKAHAKHALARARGAAPGAAAAEPELPDFSRWGEVATEPLGSVRRATARAMATAWATVPHVTQFDRADITQLESMRKRFNRRPEVAGRKVTMTAIVLKMVAAALRQFPRFNSSVDLANETLILKKYVHLGVAVDTERGLLVPVLREVDRKSLVQVAGELNDAAARARDRKLGPDDLAGAGFTVSNLGGLGTTYFSPIVPWPQVAILGVGRAEQQAVFEDGQFHPRLILPLAVSYDHRAVDGADAARFLRWLAEALEQPLLLLLDD